MTKHLLTILSVSVFGFASAQVCTPDMSFATAGPGVYPFSIATPDCSDTLGVKTIVSITDTTVSFTQPITLDVTIYYDSSRIVSVSGLPPGLSFGTDVDGFTSPFLPYGAWVNAGTIPNVTPAVGCVYVHGPQSAWQSAQLGGDTGIYVIQVEYDARIVQTDPDVSGFGVPNGTWLSAVDPNFGGGTITIQVPMDTDPVTNLEYPTITGNTSVSINTSEIYTASGNGIGYNWTVTGGSIQSGQGSSSITVLWDGGVAEGLVTVEVGDGAGCTKSENYEVAIAGVSVDEASTIEVRIYPNPSEGVFNLQLKNSETLSLRVMDVSGKVLRDLQLSGSTNYQVDMQQESSGIYILELESENGRAFHKLTKN